MNSRCKVSFLVSQEGYVLYLVLVVLTLVGMLSVTTYYVLLSSHRKVARMDQHLQARLLAEAGIERALYFFSGGDGHDIFWQTELLEETVDASKSLQLRCRRFGVFARITSSGRFRGSMHTMHCLAGRSIPRELKPTLTLSAAMGDPILAQGSTIQGPINIYKGKVWRDGFRSVDSEHTRRTTVGTYPAMPFAVEPLIAFFDTTLASLERVSNAATVLEGPIVLRAGCDSLFHGDSLIVKGDCDIEGALPPNCTILVQGRVRLLEGALLDNGFIGCSQLEIAAGQSHNALFLSQGVLRLYGGHHSSQFWSRDTVQVRSTAHLVSPAVILCQRCPNDTGELSGGVYFESRGVYDAQVICFTDTTEKTFDGTPRESIVFGKNVRFKGVLISDGAFDVQQAMVEAHVYVAMITALHDLPSVNWLYGVTIKPLEHPQPFAMLGGQPLRLWIAQQKGWPDG